MRSEMRKLIISIYTYTKDYGDKGSIKIIIKIIAADTRQCSKHFTYIYRCKSHKNPMKVLLLSPIYR